MMKNTLMLAMAVMGFVACSKEDSVENPTPTQLVEVSQDAEFLKLQYNPDGSLKSAILQDDFVTQGDPLTYVLTYNAQGKISAAQRSDGQKLVPTYEDGNLAKVDYLVGTTVVGYTEYYWINGFLKSITAKLEDNGYMVDALKYSFTYDGAGNVATTSAWIGNPFTQQLVYAGKISYTYDGKTNPLKNMSDFLLMVYQVPAKENVLKEEHFDDSNELEETVEYTYTYNARNLPKEAVVKYTPAGQPASTTTMLFKYE